MEDADGSLSFDFEGGLENVAASNNVGLGGTTGLAPSVAPLPAGAGHQAASVQAPGGLLSGPSKAPQGRKNYRQTVCRHWLRGLCMKGDACGFLHQYDKSRMPVCRFFAKFGECREPDCIYKHTNEDIKECNMYKLGFCPNGPDCRYRHQKIQGSAPSIETVAQKLSLRYPGNGGHHGRQHKSQGRGHGDGASWQQPQGSTFGQPERAEDPQNQAQLQRPPQTEAPPGQQGQPGVQHHVGNGSQPAPKLESLSTPLPHGHSRFFIVKSSNRENLNLSLERGLWATHRNNEAKLNDAYDSCENVILIFSVNETRHFQGCAQMVSKIGGVVGGGGWKYAHGTAHYGRNFRLKWLKLCELSFNKTRHLRNSYNDNLPVKISRDCQELEPSVGEQLASLLYLEPDSELMAIAKKFEKKTEEEKLSGGANTNEELEDPNIVPFEDNDDAPEENDSEDDDVSSLAGGPGHGRGRPPMRGNQMWPPNGPGLDVMERARNLGGPRPIGFRPHPDMAVDGFRMNWMGMGDGPGMPPADIFGGPPRPFLGPDNGGPGFGPMDGVGPMPGPVYFPGRPHPGAGMFPPGGPKMMGPPPRMGPPPPGLVMNPVPGGSYYMPGLNGPMMRPNRPMGMPFPPPYPGGGGKNRGHRNSEDMRPMKKPKMGDRAIASGKNPSPGLPRRSSESSDQAEFYGQDASDPSAHGSKDYLEDEDSESEDEAPRRSRHGEGKKRRRDWEEWETGAPAWDQAGDARAEMRVGVE